MPRAPAKPTFEVDDVNRALPLVRSIVTDIVANGRRVREIEAERRTARTSSSASPANGSASRSGSHVVETATARPARSLDDVKAELEDLSTQTQSYVRELSELGGDVVDLETGHVDFACERGPRTVALCWMLGEAEVAHWHAADDDAPERRPLADLPTGRSQRSRPESGGGSRRGGDSRDAGPASSS